MVKARSVCFAETVVNCAATALAAASAAAAAASAGDAAAYRKTLGSRLRPSSAIHAQAGECLGYGGQYGHMKH